MSYTSMGAVTVSGSADKANLSSLIGGGSSMPYGCSIGNLQGWLKTVRARHGMTAALPLTVTGVLDQRTIAAFDWFAAEYAVPSTATLTQVCHYLASLQAQAPVRPASWPALPAGFQRPTSSGGNILQPGWRPPMSYQPVTDVTAPPPSAMSPALKYALIGGAALLAAGGVFYIMRKKR